MKMCIQPCQPGYVDACVALAMKAESQLLAYKLETLGEEIWKAATVQWQETLEDSVRKLCADGQTYVLVREGEVVAFGGYYANGKTAAISRFVYDSEQVNTEDAGELCKYLLEDMKRRGVGYVTADAVTDPIPGGLLPVLEKAGFEKNLPHVTYYQTLGQPPELPPTQLRIIPAAEAHEEPCVTISQQLWTIIHQGYIDAIGEELHEAFSGNWRAVHKASILRLLRSGSAFVATLDGKVIGFCACRVENGVLGVISYNGVDPEQRGKGIARYMYEYAFSRLRQQGVRHVRVLTGGDPGHGPARRAYEKAGFDRALHTATYYKTL